MDLPPSPMKGHFSPNLDQPLDDPLDRTPDTFADDVERPEHMKEIVSDHAHEQPGLIGLEPVTACFVPAKGILALFDPILHIAPAVVDLDHLGLG